MVRESSFLTGRSTQFGMTSVLLSALVFLVLFFLVLVFLSLDLHFND